MMHKVEVRPNKPRDGRHCDLCGCSQPAVRCDKCGCQIFCLSCDDMYHRHPKRRFHLRKAVDPTPPTSQARPVLPMKVAHLATSPGDPSKMPLPPPRKKKPGKSFFDTFRRPSPSSDHSPPLPKKEYSWTDRLGSIKKFMSNRPLPPLPANDLEENNIQLTGVTQKHDLSFIHKRVDEKPPQLPQRSYKQPQEFFGGIEEKENHSHGENGIDIRNGSVHGPPVQRNGGFSSPEDNQWTNRKNENQFPRQLHTLDNRQNHPGFVQQGGPGYPHNFNQPLHQSISSTDLQSLPGMDGHPAMPPHYPHYPMNAPMPPHYPYPMYPQYPNYPPYFGNSFANLSSQPNTENDFSDNSEASSRQHGGRRYPFRKKAKRSQSVMVDRMGYPGQYYPFGPYPPGYAPPPWGPPFQMEAPPSPASSIRSLNRVGRTRRRKKMTSEDDDEEFSVSSSPLSRPKSSSSERPVQGFRKAQPHPQSSSSEESENEKEISRSKGSRTNRKDSDPRRLPSPATRSPQVHKKKTSKQKKTAVSEHSDADDSEPKPSRVETQHIREIVSSPTPPPGPSVSLTVPSSQWQCKHCTFINSPQNKICQVCCKTASPAEDTTTASSRPTSASSRKLSLSSEKSCSSPEKRIEDDTEDMKAKQDMENLNSALDEAEKEISRGIEELMKLKEDFSSQQSNSPKKDSPSSKKPPVVKDNVENSKPVYKSSGKMRTRMLDKLNLSLEPSTVSASTETQTGNSPAGSYDSTDKIIEARRPSTSSTTSDAYNSPIAQSPDPQQAASKTSKRNTQKDSSCQTHQDNNMDYPDRGPMEDEPRFGRQTNGFGYRYGDRLDMVTSPVPSMYDREFGGGFGMMPRSRSRASLFTGRMNDPGLMEYGMGASPMYRSVSRTSLTGDFSDNRFSEFHNLRKPDYYLSMEELVERRRQEHIRAQGLELVRMIREAEQQGFTADDIQIALSKSGNQNPLKWLQENWKNMVENVVNMSTNYGNEKKENDVGAVSEDEAREALRLHKGNIWAAVTECVESRQRKFFELKARGKFSSKAIIEALTAAQGDVGLAYSKLTKSSSKPFLMRIWGAGEGAENQDGALIPMGKSPFQSEEDLYMKQRNQEYEALSDDIWSEDEDVEWEDDAEEDEEHEQGDLDDLQTCREDLANDIITPESDKSDYADAFGTSTLERVPSLPSEEEVFPVPDEQKEKRRSGLLSKLAALRKDGSKTTSKTVTDDENQSSGEQIEQAKTYAPLNIIKNTISAIRDTVSGPLKSEKKLPCAAPERRTIIVNSQIPRDVKEENKIPETTPTINSTEAISLEVDEQINTVLKKGKKNVSKAEFKPEIQENIYKDLTQSEAKQQKQKPLEIKEIQSRTIETSLNILTENSNTKTNHSDSKINDSMPIYDDPHTKNENVIVTSFAKEKEHSSEKHNKEGKVALEVKQNSHQSNKSIEKDLPINKTQSTDAITLKETQIPSTNAVSSIETQIPSTNTITSHDTQLPSINAVTSISTEEKPVYEDKLIKDSPSHIQITQKIENPESARKGNSLSEISPEKQNSENVAMNLAVQNYDEPLPIPKTATKNEKTTANETKSNIISPINPNMKETNPTNNKTSSSVKEKTLTQQNENEILNLSMPKKVTTIKNTNLNKVKSINDSVDSMENLTSIAKKGKEIDQNSLVTFEKNNVSVDSKEKTNLVVPDENVAFNLSVESNECPFESNDSGKSGKIEDTSVSASNNFQTGGHVKMTNASVVNKIVSKAFSQETAGKADINKEIEGLNYIDSNEVVEEMATVKIFQKKKFQPAEKAETEVDIVNHDSEIKDSVTNEESKYFESNKKLITSDKEKTKPQKKLPEIVSETVTTKVEKLDDTPNGQDKLVNQQKLLFEKVTESSSSMLVHPEHKNCENAEEETELTDSKENEEFSVVLENRETDLEMPKGHCKADENAASSAADQKANISDRTTDTRSNENKSEKSTNQEVHNLGMEKLPDDVINNLNTNEREHLSLNIHTHDENVNGLTNPPSTSSMEIEKNSVLNIKITEDQSHEHIKETVVNDVNVLKNQVEDIASIRDSSINQVDEKIINSTSQQNFEAESSTKSLTGDAKSTNQFSNKTETVDSKIESLSESSGKIKDIRNSREKIPAVPDSKISKQTSRTTEFQQNTENSSNQNIPENKAVSPNLIIDQTNDQHSEPILDTAQTEKNISEDRIMSPTPSTSKVGTEGESSSSFSPPKYQNDVGIKQQEEPKKKHGILKKTPSTEGPNPNKVSFGSTDVKFSNEDPSKLQFSKIKHSSSSESSSNEGQEVSDTSDQEDNSSSADLSPTGNRRSSIDFLRSRFEGLIENGATAGPVIRPQSPFRRMSFNSRKAAIALERTKESTTDKPWVQPRPRTEPAKPVTKRTLKQQLEVERKVRKMVADRKCRTYRKAEIVVQLMEMNFEEEEAIQAANECSTLELAISFLQQECLLCTGYFPVSQIISMIHCSHMACRECIRAYFTVQIRDRNIMELLCPFCNEPDLTDEDIAQDYFNHLDIMLKKLVDEEIHELFQRKLRDRVLMRDPSFRWCSKCSSGFLAMPNLRMLVCPDCNAVTCASCRRPWEKEHQGISCEAFAALKGSEDLEAQALGLAKLLTEDGISCPRCHFRYALAKGGCMHFRCLQCQHDFCSGCSKPFKMGQKCGVSEFCAKLGLHAHHPRNCLFYLRDKDPEDLQRLLHLSDVEYDTEPPDGMESNKTCQVMEQKETADGMVDDYCGKEVEAGYAGLCRLHYVEYLGQLVNKHMVDPIQIFEKDDLELVLRRANVRLPARKYRETDDQYRERLVQLIQEELPLDKIEGS